MYFDELSIGQTATSIRKVSQKDIQMFAEVSGDFNPVHLDQAMAAATPFGGIIAHGMLSASFISSILGTTLPGQGTIYLGQTLRFLAPVRPDDEVRTVVSIKELQAEKRRAICSTKCYVGDTQVVDGEATVMVPARK